MEKHMTKLPEKALLDGSKMPKTTTGEMKTALGNLHDYLSGLLGEDSADLEKARQTLGIDLAAIHERIDAKAGHAELAEKAGKTEMADALAALRNELLETIGEKAVPAGTLAWFAMNEPPAAYLKADGSAVGRETYPALFAAIGTTFGEGDGETTFNLPNLIGRFAEGSATPGIVKEAGLPNIEGNFDMTDRVYFRSATGAFELSETKAVSTHIGAYSTSGSDSASLSAQRSNPIYGNADTVQPPALTLLPCIHT